MRFFRSLILDKYHILSFVVGSSLALKLWKGGGGTTIGGGGGGEEEEEEEEALNRHFDE